MINIIDIAIAVFFLFYVLNNAGGVARTARNILIITAYLIVFGIVIRLLLDFSFVSGATRKMFEDSYFVKVSHLLIRWGYPAVEKSAPTVNSFIKDKIISAPTPEVTVPKVTLPVKELPKIDAFDILRSLDKPSEKSSKKK